MISESHENNLYALETYNGLCVYKLVCKLSGPRCDGSCSKKLLASVLFEEVYMVYSAYEENMIQQYMDVFWHTLRKNGKPMPSYLEGWPSFWVAFLEWFSGGGGIAPNTIAYTGLGRLGSTLE